MDPNFYCEVCKIRLSGPLPALAHYKSDKHKRKERRSSPQDHGPGDVMTSPPTEEVSFSNENDRGYCNICRKELSSMVVAKQHMLGKAHKKAKDRWERQQRDADLDMNRPTIMASLSSGALSSAISPNSSTVLKQKLKPKPEETKPKPAKSRKAYDFDIDTGKGHCHACDEDMEDFKALQMHLKTDSHKQNDDVWKQKQQVDFNSDLCKTQEEDDSIETDVTDHAEENNDVAPSHPTRVVLPRVVYLADTGSWYPCDVCNVQLNTLEQLRKHEQSPKHLKMVRVREMSQNVGPGSSDLSTWYTCDICEKQLNSLEQLTIHTESHTRGSRRPSFPPQTDRTSLRKGAASDYGRTNNRSSQGNLSETFESMRIEPEREGTIANEVTSSRTKLELSRNSMSATAFSKQFSGADATRSTPSHNDHDGDMGHSKRFPTSPRRGDDTDSSRSTPSPQSENEDLSSNRSRLDSLRDSVKPDRFSTGREHHGSGPDAIKSVAASEDFQGRSNSRNSPRHITRGNTSVDPVDLGECETFQCTHHCEPCNKHHTGQKPYNQHLKSQGHKKRLAELERAQTDLDEDRPFATFYDYCEICQVPFNTEDSKEAHLAGKKHLENVLKTTKVPANRILPKIVKQPHADEELSHVNEFVRTTPRDYQVELYERAMSDDAVCFLPTGTGKTLVSIMVMSHMLRLNPHRSVVFLVDKVLLAQQQYDAIRTELGDQPIERYDENENRVVQRPLKIALVCRGRQTTQGTPLWKQDVVVATAAYFENLLRNDLVRWDDQCLVVLDESHHCVKDHPYQRLLERHHCVPGISPIIFGYSHTRPKLLGLTASPAGKQDVPQTKLMLRSLLRNLGDAKMVAVQRFTKELQQYQSTTCLDIKMIHFSKLETSLEMCLQDYIAKCIQHLRRETNIDAVLRDLEILDPEDAGIPDFSNGLIVEMSSEILDAIKLKEPRRKVFVDSLRGHTKALCNALLSLREYGMDFACNELQDLNDASHIGSFDHARELDINLPCDKLRGELELYQNQNISKMDSKTDSTFKKKMKVMSIVKHLVAEITDERYINWNNMRESSSKREEVQRPIVLVLVRKRKWAKSLETRLNECEDFQQREIKCVSVVGHGENASDGMTVRRQDEVMNKIRAHKYQVIIATAIAEEGLDFPLCELVIQLDPPTSVTSLVQIRGRARKQDSRFVALCRTTAQKEGLESLQRREAYMTRAVMEIIEEQREVT